MLNIDQNNKYDQIYKVLPLSFELINLSRGRLAHTWMCCSLPLWNTVIIRNLGHTLNLHFNNSAYLSLVENLHAQI